MQNTTIGRRSGSMRENRQSTKAKSEKNDEQYAQFAVSFACNERGEVISAQIGASQFAHAYDFIGNQTNFVANATTNSYTHNALNQVSTTQEISAPSAPLREISHDLGGNLTNDSVFIYSYDAANRLASVSSNGIVLVANQYDDRGRRIRKTTPTTETTYVYDGWNLIHESIVTISGCVTNSSEVQYFWGADLSNTLQGAGGVGGLLAVSINSNFYFPAYDNNGNITKYIDENGNIVAAYEYDAFGRTISLTGTMAYFFRHRFSTKYFDPETGFYYYGYRFYSPTFMRWLNRDPIEEAGGLNLYGFCGNSPSCVIDFAGNIPVSVVTWRHNNILQRIVAGGNVYSIVNVKEPSDISVRNMSSSTRWGLFSYSLQIEKCQVVVALMVLLNDRMVTTGGKNITYYYVPHNGEKGGVSSTSDGSPPVRDAVLAHELGHAQSFLQTFLPRFQKEVDKFPAGHLTERDKSDIQRIFNQCLNEASADSGNKANEAQINWYRENGYQFEVK